MKPLAALLALLLLALWRLYRAGEVWRRWPQSPSEPRGDSKDLSVASKHVRPAYRVAPFPYTGTTAAATTRVWIATGVHPEGRHVAGCPACSPVEGYRAEGRM